MIATPQSKRRQPALSPLAVRKGARVLVVEDDAEMGHWVAETLEEEGFETQVVSDGFTAVMSLLTEGVDAVVTDWKMPGFDGLRLLESMRTVAPGTPVIFVTAYAEPGLHEHVRERGAFSLLEKPFHRDELLSHLTNALQPGMPRAS